MKHTLLVGGDLIAYLRQKAPVLLDDRSHRYLLSHFLQVLRGDGGLDKHDGDEVAPPRQWMRGVITHKEVARCAGRLKQGLQRNFRATPVLFDFVETLHQLGWAAQLVKHSYVEGRASVIQFEWPSALLEAWDAGERMRKNNQRATLVFLGSMERYTAERMSELNALDKEERRQIAAADLREVGIPLSPHVVIDYHAKYDPVHLPALRARAETVLAAARQAAELEGPGRERARRAVTGLLAYLEDTSDGAPVGLRRVRRSDRVYPDGPSLLTVPREFRDQVFQGMGAITLDLSFAQLACLSVIYQCPAIFHQLSSKENWWKVILKHMFPVNGRPEAKGAIKGATYGGGYGEAKSKTFNRMMRDLRALGIPHEEARAGVKSYMAHPITKALYESRNATFEQIRRDGGIKTPTGAWIACSASNRPHQVAAQAAQAVEQTIITTVYEVAEKVGFWILQNRFDGLVIMPYPGVDVWDCIAAAAAAVQGRARSLDVPTALEAAPVGGEVLPPRPLPYRVLERMLMERVERGGRVLKMKPLMAEGGAQEEGRGRGEGRKGGQGRAEHVSYIPGYLYPSPHIHLWLEDPHLARAVRDTRAGPRAACLPVA